jgi:carboxymethylenebutenolidase
MRQQSSTRDQSSTVRFGSGIRAFRALPKAKGRRPAVILLHERYGVVQHTKDLTLKLAQGGYVGLAPDLFSRFTGDRKALQRGEARMELRDDEVVKDLGEAIDYLKSLGSVDASRIGIIGICQTGRQSLLLAARRKDILSCVVFYGAAGGKEWTTDELRPEPIEALIENLSCPLLGVFGEADHIISLDDVLRFRACLERSRKSYHVRLYRDAPHGWLNDTMPGRYRHEAARDAWRLLLSFLKKTFSNGWDRNRVLCTFESDFSPGYDFGKNVRLE